MVLAGTTVDLKLGWQSLHTMLAVELTDNPSSRLFSALELDQRDLVVRLGLATMDHAESCVQKWSDTEHQERIAKLQHALNVQADDAAKQVREAVRSARDSERACADAEQTRLREDADRWRSELVALQLESSRACEAKVAEMRDTYDSRIDQLRSDYESKLAALASDADREATRRCEGLQASINELVSKSLTTEDRQRMEVANLRSGYEKKLEDLRRRLEEAQGQQLCSSRKGNKGEAVVLAHLHQLFPKAEIEDTHSVPGRGDFVVRDDGLVMMVETKNYARNVPKAEVDKFYRDLETPGNEEFQCAVLVSQRSGVCCREDFAFEMRGTKPVLFIHKLEENYESLVLAAKFFKLVLDASEAVDLQSKSIQDELRAAGSCMLRGFNDQKAAINRFHSTQLDQIAAQQACLVQLLGSLGQKL